MLNEQQGSVDIQHTMPPIKIICYAQCDNKYTGIMCVPKKISLFLYRKFSSTNEQPQSIAMCEWVPCVPSLSLKISLAEEDGLGWVKKVWRRWSNACHNMVYRSVPLPVLNLTQLTSTCEEDTMLQQESTPMPMQWLLQNRIYGMSQVETTYTISLLVKIAVSPLGGGGGGEYLYLHLMTMRNLTTLRSPNERSVYAPSSSRKCTQKLLNDTNMAY